jgi:hypothetical protein
MLRVPTLPGSLGRVLEALRPCFTTPTFTTYVTLLTGMVARSANRTVCGMLADAQCHPCHGKVQRAAIGDGR